MKKAGYGVQPRGFVEQEPMPEIRSTRSRGTEARAGPTVGQTVVNIQYSRVTEARARPKAGQTVVNMVEEQRPELGL